MKIRREAEERTKEGKEFHRVGVRKSVSWDGKPGFEDLS